jgi:predicted ATPase
VIATVYQDLRYELCEVPKLSPRDRAKFVLQQLNLLLSG